MIALFHAQGLRARKARKANPADDGERHQHVFDAGSEYGGQCDREQNARESKENIHDARADRVDDAAEPGDGHTEGRADHDGNRNDRERDRTRDTRPEQDTPANITAEIIAPQYSS